MSVTNTILLIDSIIECIKEGMEIIITFNEYFANRKAGRIESAKRQLSTYYEIVDIKGEKGRIDPKRDCGNICLYLSEPLYCAGALENSPLQRMNVMFECFHDNEPLKQISSVISDHPDDSLIVVRNDNRNNQFNLQIEMINLVPGNDNLCYRVICKGEGNLKKDDYKTVVQNLLNEVITEIIKTYKKYQQTVSESFDRLELEAKILLKMGYPNLIFKPVRMGYGLEILQGKRKLLIGIPREYPKKPPTVALLQDDYYREVEFQDNWESLLTLGHIVRALEEKRLS